MIDCQKKPLWFSFDHNLCSLFTMMKSEPLDTLRCVSMMTGTSIDGVDAVCVEFSDVNTNPTHNVIGHHHKSFIEDVSESYRSEAIRVMSSMKLQESVLLGQHLSQAYADALHLLLQKISMDASSIDFLAVSGHTLFHQPPADGQKGYTIDMTDLSMLAAITGITSIGKFRSFDMAMGGHGAPLAPFAHGFVFDVPDRHYLVQNMGGIGNITLLEDQVPIMGFDTGPGNVWMDLVTQWKTQGQKRFDEDGALAQKGKVDQDLARQMLAHAYFDDAPPKSTGPETLGEIYLTRFRPALDKLSKEDALATVTWATAQSVADATQAFVMKDFAPSGMVICGGGAKNPTLVSMIADALPGCEVQTSEGFGINPHWVEPVCFAYLGLHRLLGKANTIPAITGAFRPTCGGEIAYALA